MRFAPRNPTETQRRLRFSIPVFSSTPSTSTAKRVFSNSQSHRADRSNEDVSSALTPISDGVTFPPRVFRRSFASMRSSIDFGRLSAPISAWAFRPRFSFVSGLLVSASSVSSAFLPSSVDASTVAAFFVAACVSVWGEWWVWGSAPRVDPVELARCIRAGHMTVLWQAAPRQPREGAPGRRSRPLGLALSAPLPGDFRPVIVSVLEKRFRPRSSPKRASAPPRANREIRGGFGGRGSYKSTEGDPSRAPTLVLRPYSSKGCRMAKHRSGDRATSTPTSAPARGVK